MSGNTSSSTQDIIALTLFKVLDDVNEDLRRRFHPSRVSVPANTKKEATDKSGNDAADKDDEVSLGDDEPVVLDALTESDWSNVLYPIGELRPYLMSSTLHSAQQKRSTASAARGKAKEKVKEEDGSEDDQLSFPLRVLEDYICCRGSELPMRLQTEALLLRTHENEHRQSMNELIRLSEFMTFSGAHAPVLPPDAARKPELAEGLAQFTSADEARQRVARCEERIAELEDRLQRHALGKIRCSQRMVLLCEVVEALMGQLKRLQEAEEEGGSNPSSAKKRRT